MTQLLAAIGYPQWGLHALLLLPLLGVLPILFGPARAVKRIALVVTLAEFVLSLGLWWAFDTSPGTLQLNFSVPWIPAWGISYAVGIDAIAMTMVLLTTLLMPLCVAAGAYLGSALSLQTAQINPAISGNDDWKAGIYQTNGLVSLNALGAVAGIIGQTRPPRLATTRGRSVSASGAGFG